MAANPTIKLSEVSQIVQDPTTTFSAKKVLEGMLNDYMDLLYGKETPYTTGKQVLPTGATIENVNSARDEAATQKLKNVFAKISDTFVSGDMTPQSHNDGSWDTKFTPVLLLISSDN